MENESLLVHTYEICSPEMSASSNSENLPMMGSGHLRNDSYESTAAVKLQKVYRSYRTRRRLADSAVVAEELWWQAIDYARLNHSTISFFNSLKPEPASARWSRISLNASKVGKGLSKDARAQKLAFQHWLEAIDPRHRYGHNLNLYYEEWCKADAGQPFFYWLDIGDGKEVDLKECSRLQLRQECIKYLGPQEREHYEYIITGGTVQQKLTGDFLDTNQGLKGSKWIFVMSTSKTLYVGEKKKGLFHHSSFLAGGATLAAGRLKAEGGKLRSVSAYSGHYRPTEENLGSFLTLLKENGVQIHEIQVVSPTEDHENFDISKAVGELSYRDFLKDAEPTKLRISSLTEKNQSSETSKFAQIERNYSCRRTLSTELKRSKTMVPKNDILQRIKSKKEASSYQLGNQMSLKWSTGAGPRIGCVADYPVDLRVQALNFVDLSSKDSSLPLDCQQLPAPPLSATFCVVM